MSTVVVAGALANKPGNAGAAWTRASWARGFRALGFDVHFVEQLATAADVDAESWFASCTAWFGLDGSSTLLRADGSTAVGMAADDLAQLASDAVALVNISGHLTLAEIVDRFRCTVFVDLDPGYTQVWHADGLASLRPHDHWFTVGTRIGTEGCAIPTAGIDWVHTLQPVDVEHWQPEQTRRDACFTTVGAWRGYGPIEIGERTFGPKAHEFRRLVDLPTHCPAASFELALDIADADAADRVSLAEHGWRIVDPSAVAADPSAFERYIQGSLAEFSVAQAVYSRTCSGWFSDRTARYLAAGLPAVVQDTGIQALPTGEGMLTFSTRTDALRAVESVLASYEVHRRRAREIAASYLSPQAVLGPICERAGVAP